MRKVVDTTFGREVVIKGRSHAHFFEKSGITRLGYGYGRNNNNSGLRNNNNYYTDTVRNDMSSIVCHASELVNH